MQIINIFKQISHEEESVDFVLMLGRLGKLIYFVGASFKTRRIVLAEMPCSERGLRERLFGRQRVVDERVRSGQSSVQTGNAVRRIK